MCEFIVYGGPDCDKLEVDQVVGEFRYSEEEYSSEIGAVRSTLEKFEKILELNEAGLWVTVVGCSLCWYTNKIGGCLDCTLCPFKIKFKISCTIYKPYSSFSRARKASEQIKYTQQIIDMLRWWLKDLEGDKDV